MLCKNLPLLFTSSATYLEYLTAAQLKVGAGFPRELVSRDSPYTLALIYAGPAPNNALCAAAQGGRKRRAVDTGKWPGNGRLIVLCNLYVLQKTMQIKHIFK